VTSGNNVNQSSDSLAAAMAERGIELPGPQVKQLEKYCGLLWDWNTRLNLTRHTDWRKFVSRDLVDSLVFAEFLGQRERVLDVGTGGGVPGVVLAIVRPDLSVSLSESVGKRAQAVADIVRKLRLNVPVYNSRAEDLLADYPQNTLVVRAVAPLPKLLRWFRPHFNRFDRLLVLKGPAWVEERAEARHLGLLKNEALRKLKAYPMPESGSESMLLQICPKRRLLEGGRCQLTDWE
jgi:16S rRNA (guanine527-N7)-methyltransferase